MLSDFWHYLATLPPGAATFLGTLTGSTVGLVALLVGALFNAHLNRKRDDRLRSEDAMSVRAALKAELQAIKSAFERNADGLEKNPPPAGYVLPDPAHMVRVMPALLPKFGLLEAAAIGPVIEIYVSIDQICETLILFGGSIDRRNRSDRRLLHMPASSAASVATTIRNFAKQIEPVIAKLDGNT